MAIKHEAINYFYSSKNKLTAITVQCCGYDIYLICDPQPSLELILSRLTYPSRQSSKVDDRLKSVYFLTHKFQALLIAQFYFFQPAREFVQY